MSLSMRAVRFHEYGDSKKLSVDTIPRPVPGANEILVKVQFAGVNPIDWKLRGGFYKTFMPVTFPSTPGREFAGVIDEVGANVKNLSKGQKVFGPADGTYAEYVAVPATEVALIPEGVSLESAATVSLGALTAWHVVEEANVKTGQTVLVLGAAGGVGLFAAQFARLKGAKVLGVASAANLDFVRSLGAEAVDYSTGPLADRVKSADVVIDTVGGATLESAYTLVKRGGILLTVAGMPSEERAKELGISARTSGNRGAEPLGKIAALLASGKLVTEVGKIFALTEASAAQDLSQTGHGRGRILLRV